jgi:hypothetical protein
MRKHDNRGRRDRSTLTVDLTGAYAYVLDTLIQKIGEERRRLGRVSSRRMTRGEAIRFALRAVSVALQKAPTLIDHLIITED